MQIWEISLLVWIFVKVKAEGEVENTITILEYYYAIKYYRIIFNKIEDLLLT